MNLKEYFQTNAQLSLVQKSLLKFGYFGTWVSIYNDIFRRKNYTMSPKIKFNYFDFKFSLKPKYHH